MTALNVAAGLAIVAAVGHSFLSERLFLRPLRAERVEDGVFAPSSAKKLASAMFHLASVCWISMAASLVLLDPVTDAQRAVLLIYAAVFALSGAGNFWAIGRPHPGGVLLIFTAALIVFAVLA